MPSPRLDLLVVADHFRGGLGAAAQAHARWFADEGWAVALAADEPVAQEIVPAEAVHVPVPGAASDLAGMWAATAALRTLLRHRRPRVVHAHGTRSQMLTLLAGRVPYVTMHGGGRVAGQGPLGAGLRRASRISASWVAIRAYSAAPAPGRWRATLHASPSLSGLGRLPPEDMADEPTFVWVGRMDAPKQPEVFVEACTLAARTRPVRGVMLGDGPRLAEVRALASRLGAPVDVLGASSDVPSHLRAAWALCLFSGFEGVPFAVQEAMWAGRAVVVSPLPSLRWFAGDAATYAGEVASAAAAIVELTDRAVAQRQGRQAAARAREVLTVDAPFPELMADYAARR